MWVTSPRRLTDRVKSPGLLLLGLARKLPSLPLSSSRCSDSTPWMFGWNHRREDITPLPTPHSSPLLFPITHSSLLLTCHHSSSFFTPHCGYKGGTTTGRHPAPHPFLLTPPHFSCLTRPHPPLLLLTPHGFGLPPPATSQSSWASYPAPALQVSAPPAAHLKVTGVTATTVAGR